MKLSALFFYVLSLFGCDVGRDTFVDRISIDGAQALYSKATVEAGVARFECVRSASGQCVYTLFPRECDGANASAKGKADCLSQPIEQFVVANGDTRQIAGLRDFRLCVSDEHAAPGPGCQVPQPMAKR
ncbi:hypothetical protein [Lysobacter sp.]|uniref:hypothetical protein n=1 Tax=Lysobacter sp. TaxID=72226 RepID=UPI002D25A267|nr:hypothetical protein [Lysobacter sp.]HZX79200.1 hypothetical protein [Lysobacter sp.]